MISIFFFKTNYFSKFSLGFSYWTSILGSIVAEASIAVKTLLQLCIVGSCTVGVTENFEEFCKFISRLALKSVAFVGKNALQISMIRQEYLLTLIQLSHFCGWC